MGEAIQERRYVDELPSALTVELGEVLEGRNLAVFLDYDGTLTPIVDHPDRALLAEPTRVALQRLARVHPVAIVSGRDRADVEEKVGLEEIYYAGSHGFDISGPGGFREERGEEYLPALEAAITELAKGASGFDGVWVEQKRYAAAVHFRGAPAGSEPAVERLVRDIARAHPELRVSGGKKILELRPAMEWDKGRAVLWLRRALGVADNHVTLYIGDDETDEDAFGALDRDPGGVGIVVGISRRPTRARFSLADAAEVRLLLERLADGEGL